MLSAECRVAMRVTTPVLIFRLCLSACAPRILLRCVGFRIFRLCTCMIMYTLWTNTSSGYPARRLWNVRVASLYLFFRTPRTAGLLHRLPVPQHETPYTGPDTLRNRLTPETRTGSHRPLADWLRNSMQDSIDPFLWTGYRYRYKCCESDEKAATD